MTGKFFSLAKEVLRGLFRRGNAIRAERNREFIAGEKDNNVQRDVPPRAAD